MNDAPENNPVLSLRGITRTYKQGDAELRIFAGADLDIWPGQIVALVGPSGSGKSSLLHIAGLLEAPNAGEVWIGGPVKGQPGKPLARRFPNGSRIVGVTTNRRLLVNSSGRAQIKTGQSCGVSVPLTAILYGSAGTVVQVVRRARVETRRVETGLMSAGQVEITTGLQEGDIVVARAGALLREGDPVRPVTGSADVK